MSENTTSEGLTDAEARALGVILVRRNYGYAIYDLNEGYRLGGYETRPTAEIVRAAREKWPNGDGLPRLAPKYRK